MGAKRILIVSDDDAVREALGGTLAACGYEVDGVHDLAGFEPAVGTRFDALVMDRESFLEAQGDDRLSRLAQGVAFVPVLVTTPASLDLPDAIALVHRGAFSVLPLPLEPARVTLLLEQAVRHAELAERNAELQRGIEVNERLAMIGKLAAGVAHELNNPLDGVLRFVNLAVDSLPKDAPQIPYLLESRRGLRRMADIVRDLLQFSRHAAVESNDEDGERMARDAVAQSLPKEAQPEFRIDFAFPLEGVALPRAMFQVLANLAKNAFDAMPAGGRLSVAAHVGGGRVHVTVGDDGCGIPEEIQDRVFEPFFTTKDVGRGTGLGLPICRRIVERLGGTMEIESEPGHGTTVSVDLPLRRRANAAAARRQNEFLEAAHAPRAAHRE